MKRVMFGLILFLFMLISVNAANPTYMPLPGVVFELKSVECFSNGSIDINLTHEGASVAFKDINLTAESEDLNNLPMIGEWMYGGYPITNYGTPTENYTGSDFFGKRIFKFETTHNIYTKGKYTITLVWPSNSAFYDRIKFAVECPGISCTDNDRCISQQSCSNSTCAWIKCDESSFASGHVCLPRCNDYDSCTNDYFIDGQCVYIKTEGCNPSEVNKEVKFQSTLSKIIEWLKSLYK